MTDQKDNEYRGVVLTLDGDPHYDSKTTDCCQSTGQECPECRGWMHYQAIYGGYIYQCEDCKYVG